MSMKGIPFLTLSEFVRDKLKTWSMQVPFHLRPFAWLIKRIHVHSRRSDRDANDIVYTLCRYWNRLDINRVPEQDMNQFVTFHRTAALSWAALKRKYRM